MLVDTHCHIHSDDYGLDADNVIALASKAGVTHIICVGTDAADSARAVEFVQKRPNCWASVGLHPHEAKLGREPLDELKNLLHHKTPSSGARPWTKIIPDIQPQALSGARPWKKVVAVGECGLDYYYLHSSKADQESALRSQIELALEYDLPLIFHVREAFDDFWRILDSYTGLRGVVHSFTADSGVLDQVLTRGLYAGFNGIMTFTKDADQLEAARAVPLERLVLETDAPFLTPKPHRGTINEPRYVALIAGFLAELRQEELSELQKVTTQNAIELFNLG